MSELLIKLGDSVEPWGTFDAVHSSRGERSYFFTDEHGSISLVPEETVKRQIEESKP